MSGYTTQQADTLTDILREKKLPQVFWRSLRLKYSRTNIRIGFGVALCVFLVTFFLGDQKSCIERVRDFSEMAFNSCINLIGFLLAGYSFFATMADKKLFCRMAEVPHPESGLSYLKYNMLSFMRMFIEFLIGIALYLVSHFVLTEDNGFLTMVRMMGLTQNMKLFAISTLYGLITGTFSFLLMQLSIFIYNIYHVVMSSIYWELLNEYQLQQSKTEED